MEGFILKIKTKYKIEKYTATKNNDLETFFIRNGLEIFHSKSNLFLMVLFVLFYLSSYFFV